MSIQQLSEHVFYMAGGVNCVILKKDTDAVLIDTGQDKNYGRDLRKACDSLGVTPKAIINTHSHADHYGGNDYLLRQFDVPVYAPAFEASIMASPYLEPVYLFNGAKPLSELMSKWLLAKASKVDYALTAGNLNLIGLELQVIDTSGHAHCQMSLICDDVLIAADALFGKNVLDKYPLPFGQDVKRQIESMNSLAALDVAWVLPGHGEPSQNLKQMAADNLLVIENAATIILDKCQSSTTEEVLAASCHALNISMNDIPRYYLNLCVISAYLSYLREENKVGTELNGNRLLWSKQ